MNLPKLSLICSFLAAVLFTSGCNEEAAHSHDDHNHGEKPIVVVPVPPYTGLVKRIAGDSVEVVTLVGVGKDPHFFSPTPKQVARVNQAAVYFTVGMPFEADLIASLKESAPNLKIIDLTKGIELLEIDHSCLEHDHDHADHAEHDHSEHDHSEHDHSEHDHSEHDHSEHDHSEHDHSEHDHSEHDHSEHDHSEHDHSEHDHSEHDHSEHDHSEHDHSEHDHTEKAESTDPHAGHVHKPGESDPHVWLSPELLLNQVHILHAVLEGVTGEDHSGAVHKNSEELEAELTLLDYDLALKLKPLKGQSFYVYHGAFGYFASAYGLKQESIQLGGKSPEPKRLATIIEQAKAEDVKMIFVQPQFDQTSAKAIAEAIGGTVLSVDPLKEDVIANLRSIADAIIESK